MMVIYSETGSLHLLNFKSIQGHHKEISETMSITALEFTSDGKYLILAMRDGSLNLMDLNGNFISKEDQTFHKEPITKIRTGGLGAKDGLIVTLSSDLCVIWSEVSLKLITKMRAPNSTVAFVDANLELPDRITVLFSDGNSFSWSKESFFEAHKSNTLLSN